MMRKQHDESRSILTLTSDFGTAGGYVGVMKGLVLSSAPHVSIHDISHDIAAQDVVEGAWCLARAVPQFPSGSVHLAVVDPGVGSDRAGLIVETERFLLVGPDNGLLFLAAQRGGTRRVFAIAESPPEIQRSASFEGLTLFAPVAAHLLLGASPASLGAPMQDMAPLRVPEPTYSTGVVDGEILLFDHFGNAITNITRNDLGAAAAGHVKLPETGEARFVTHYAADLEPNAAQQGHGAAQPLALWNSDGHLELAVYGASLENILGLHRGDRVRLMLESDGS